MEYQGSGPVSPHHDLTAYSQAVNPISLQTDIPPPAIMSATPEMLPVAVESAAAEGEFSEPASVPEAPVAVAPVAVAAESAAHSVIASAAPGLMVIRPAIIGRDIPNQLTENGDFHEEPRIVGIDFPEEGSHPNAELAEGQEQGEENEQLEQEGEEDEEELENEERVKEESNSKAMLIKHLRALFESMAHRQDEIERKIAQALEFVRGENNRMRQEREAFSQMKTSMANHHEELMKVKHSMTEHQNRLMAMQHSMASQQQHQEEIRSLEHHLLKELEEHLGAITESLRHAMSTSLAKRNPGRLLHALRKELQSALAHAVVSYQAQHLADGNEGHAPGNQKLDMLEQTMHSILQRLNERNIRVPAQFDARAQIEHGHELGHEHGHGHNHGHEHGFEHHMPHHGGQEHESLQHVAHGHLKTYLHNRVINNAT